MKKLLDILRAGLLFLALGVSTAKASSMPSIHSILLPGSNFNGELTQGGVIVGVIPLGAALWLDKKKLEVSPKGEVVFGFGRDAYLEHVLMMRLKNGHIIKARIILEKRKYHIQRITGISKAIMQPNKTNIKRILREVKEVKTARNTNSKFDFFMGDFKWPLEGPITGVYGSQRYFNGIPKRPHFGVDVAAPIGTKVKAPEDGRVTLADDLFLSGGTIILDHGYGLSTSFLHLSKILVKKGQMVKQGDIIGLVGKRGRATGPHLDWRVNWFQTRIDASKIVGKMPKKR
jgi:murein DD-endopeptidase MepM/ murein hydrolase activator NlpD